LKIEEKKRYDGVTIEEFKKLCEKFLPPLSAKFVQVQATLNNKKQCGKRYTDDYKKFALQLYFISPKAYKFMKKTFMLPSIRTLQRFAHGMNFEP
jgi:hypothetical protein